MLKDIKSSKTNRNVCLTESATKVISVMQVLETSRHNSIKSKLMTVFTCGGSNCAKKNAYCQCC